jgi:drug/metabolite transporter (DMT)-like permease
VRAKFLPYLSLAGGVLALSFSPVFVRWAEAPGPVTSFFRMTTAALVLAPFALRLIGKELKPHMSGFNSLINPILLGLLGGLLTAGDHGFWSTALASTSVANATLFNYIAPLWVALFAALVWREQLRARFWLGLALVLVGMAVVIGAGLDKTFKFNPGDILAVVSSFFYAAYFLVAQRGRKRLPTLVFIWLVALGAALGLLGLCLALRLPLSGYPPMTYLAFLLAGLFSQIGGYFMVAYALGHLSAAVVAPTMIAQPVLSALLAIPIAGELLSAGQLLGGLAVLAGIGVVNRENRT